MAAPMGIFFHPDYTVGTGIEPVQRGCARGLYRRWGIAPRPEDTVQFYYTIALTRHLVKGQMV